MTSPPTYQGFIAFGFAVAPVVVTLIVVFRRRLPRLDGAFFLVLWGLFIVVAEHVGFGVGRFGGSDLLSHTAGGSMRV